MAKRCKKKPVKAQKTFDLEQWVNRGFEGGSKIKKSWKDRMREWPCFYCNKTSDLTDSNKRNTVDHIKARALGGPDQPDNAVACCPKCNVEKDQKTVEEWFAFLYEKGDPRAFAAVILLSRPYKSVENRSHWWHYQAWPELP